MSLRIKRVYAPLEKSDGIRILVDRLWPRGISKEKARIDEWMKDISPSPPLRKWFHHQIEIWDEFQRRYRAELEEPDRKALMARLQAMSRKRTVTLLFAARDEEHNSARILVSVINSAKH